jgi:hypothetical protein
MRFIDRFTRDDVSAKVWWPFTMLLLVLLVLTFPGEHRAIDARHRATAQADAALGERVIAPLLATAPSAAITDTLRAQLTEEIHDEILVNDGRIKAVRIWSPTTYQLIWSSTGERLDVANALNDGDIDAAVAAAGAPTWVTTNRSPGNAPSPTLYYAYASQGSQHLVAQFEYLDSELTSDVRFAWLGSQIALGVGLLLALVFALLSMREPKARIGTGVPFYPESLPADLSVVDSDRAVVIEQSAARIRERVGALQNALDESETARRRAEGRLQQALTALNTPGQRMPIPTGEPSTEAAPPAIVRVPKAPVRAPAPRPAADVPAPRVREPEPAPEPEPIVPEPIPEPEPIVPRPEPEPIVPEPIEPEPVAEVVSEPASEPATAATQEPGGWPEVVVVPELQPAKRAPASGQESASDMLDRLVEPVGAHDPSEDAGDLRARLARTAAIKKPGSKERREADEQHHRD